MEFNKDAENNPPVSNFDEQVAEQHVRDLLTDFFHCLHQMDAKGSWNCFSPYFRTRLLTDENIKKYKKTLRYGEHTSAISVPLMHILSDKVIDCSVSATMHSDKGTVDRKYDFYLVHTDDKWVIDNIVLLKTRKLAL